MADGLWPPSPKVEIKLDFSLITEAWLPVMRRNSGFCWIRPSQIVEALNTDPVIDVAWPRADFDLATKEFLIGLLAVACPPTSRNDWHQRNNSPPDIATLDAAFAPFKGVFNLDSFMQDFEPLPGEANDVATLLIESPGEQSIKKNTDLFNKRGKVQSLSRAAAAISLYALQTYAPAGGAGNRTGLRGGGPLTTLVIPPGQPTLWHILWANVPTGEIAPKADWPHIFPWLTKTITSENKRTVSPKTNNDPLAFWGTPRRIRLVFEKNKDNKLCDLTGQTDEVIVTGWVQRPNGANYNSDSFKHPLTPRYKPKPKEPVSLPVHPQPAGIGYRDLLGILFASEDGAAIPAAAISTYVSNRLPNLNAKWRILAAGYDMDNMKARGFVEAELPTFGGGEAPDRVKAITHLILGAETVEGILRTAVRMALLSDGAKPDANAGLLGTLRARFWAESEGGFYKASEQIANGEEQDNAVRGFLSTLHNLCAKLFDENAPIVSSDHPERVAKGAGFLMSALKGYGKSGKSLFTVLNLELPAQPKKGKAT